MSWFKKPREPVIPGDLVKDYGVVNEQLKGLVRFKHRVLLVNQHGKKKIIIREGSTLVGREIKDFEFDREGAARLKEALDNALRIM